MHKVIVAEGWDVTRIALLEIIVNFCCRWYVIELELIDLLAMTECKLCPR